MPSVVMVALKLAHKPVGCLVLIGLPTRQRNQVNTHRFASKELVRFIVVTQRHLR